MRTAIFRIITAGMILSAGWLQAHGIRKPVWAGTFYLDDPGALAQQIDQMLQASIPPASSGDRLLAIIAPHAGYIYSGQTAAAAYRLVKGRTYKTVVILGTAHRYGFRGCSIYPNGGYASPLGIATINSALAEKISQASGYGYIPAAHKQEHSIEVQIPFIQKILPSAQIVPILIGTPEKQTITRLSRALHSSLSGENALVVASTDMSHFLPRSAAAEKAQNTIQLIQAMETAALIPDLENRKNIMCGGSGVIAALLLARNYPDPRVKIIQYTDSSVVSGSEKEVVGYLSAAIFAGSEPPAFALPQKARSELLRLARSALERFVRQGEIQSYTPAAPVLATQKGAFVTLKNRGRLRGCIGFIEPVAPLYKTVIQAAVYAASKDIRFKPVSPAELAGLEIEISVLSLPQKISDPNKVTVGKHGLIIVKGDRQVLLLPQVPVEQQWSRKTFLQQACVKAGLAKTAWESGAAIYTFEAIVFHENKN